jgi:uncharacterized protein (TIGR04222 family)
MRDISMLNSVQTDLYQRLQDFELDNPAHEFGFTRHLMKNHGWTLVQAQRTIIEYKKFAFLTVVADHQIVPSDRVDQVWHAHVLLTQSYWEEFCPKVLGQKLHHHPAQGGKKERAEFHILYAKTIASYRHFFGSPPTDIWSPPDRRFGAELKMQRINTREHWVIPKRLPQLHLSKVSIVATIAIAISIGYMESVQAASTRTTLSNPAIEPVMIVILSIIMGIALRYWIQMPGEQTQKPQLNIYQMAYLAGGGSRAAELAIVQLVKQGYLRPNVRNRTLSIEKLLPAGATRLEQQVMLQVRATPDFKNIRLSSKYNDSILLVWEQLKQEQLLMTGWKVLVGVSFIIFLSATGLGWALLSTISAISGIASGGIWNILGTSWYGVSIVTFCCFVPSGRTRWGNKILADIRKNHDIYDVLQRFALDGDQVLSGGALDDLKQIYKAEEAEADSGGGCGC